MDTKTVMGVRRLRRRASRTPPRKTNYCTSPVLQLTLHRSTRLPDRSSWTPARRAGRHCFRRLLRHRWLLSVVSYNSCITSQRPTPYGERELATVSRAVVRTMVGSYYSAGKDTASLMPIGLSFEVPRAHWWIHGVIQKGHGRI